MIVHTNTHRPNFLTRNY